MRNMIHKDIENIAYQNRGESRENAGGVLGPIEPEASRHSIGSNIGSSDGLGNTKRQTTLIPITFQTADAPSSPECCLNVYAPRSSLLCRRDRLRVLHMNGTNGMGCMPFQGAYVG